MTVVICGQCGARREGLVPLSLVDNDRPIVKAAIEETEKWAAMHVDCSASPAYRKIPIQVRSFQEEVATSARERLNSGLPVEPSLFCLYEGGAREVFALSRLADHGPTRPKAVEALHALLRYSHRQNQRQPIAVIGLAEVSVTGIDGLWMPVLTSSSGWQFFYPINRTSETAPPGSINFGAVEQTPILRETPLLDGLLPENLPEMLPPDVGAGITEALPEAMREEMENHFRGAFP